MFIIWIDQFYKTIFIQMYNIFKYFYILFWNVTNGKAFATFLLLILTIFFLKFGFQVAF